MSAGPLSAHCGSSAQSLDSAEVVKGFGYRPVDDLSAGAEGRCSLIAPRLASKFLSSAEAPFLRRRLRIEVARRGGQDWPRATAVGGVVLTAAAGATLSDRNLCHVLPGSWFFPRSARAGQPQPGIGETGTAMSETRSTPRGVSQRRPRDCQASSRLGRVSACS